MHIVPMDNCQVIIIGAGPSGLAAAIQLKRQGIGCLVLEKNRPGGLLQNANLVENYPGFPEGIKGPDLARLFTMQADRNDVEIVIAEVTALEYEDDRFIVTSQDQNYEAKIVLLGSGTQPKTLPGLTMPPNCLDLVHYEVAALSEIHEQQLVIVGAGDAAFDYALNLAERNNRVTILNRSDKSAALALLQTRVELSDQISYLTNSSVKSISRTADNGLQIDISQGENALPIAADHLLIAIGREPADKFLTDRLKKQLSRLQADGRLYIVGDLNAGMFRQTSIATGEAVRAAMMIQQKLEGLS